MCIRLRWSLISLLFFCLPISKSHAQSIPDFGEVFDQNEVTAIYITIDPDSLSTMIAALDNEHDYPADFVFQSNGLNDTIAGIGFRLRGNTSIGAAKKSFKIAFNAFDTGGQWQGLEKMNLLATVNDPSLMRSKIAHDLFRAYGIRAARTSYTQLFINNEFRGVYLNVEHIDEQMASLYFDGQGDGNLYKCTYPADLAFISNNPDDYKFSLWGYRHYDLTTNDYLDDYTDLAHFISVLNNTAAAQTSCALPAVFNIEQYLKIAAIDILLGNWDGYIFNKNNFYLYHDQLTQQVNYIPYDLDNTLGIDWVGTNWSERNIYNWAPTNEARPLYARIMSNAAWRSRFSQHVETLCNTLFNADSLAQQIEHWQNLLEPYLINDTYYPLDFGYTLNDFSAAANTGCCSHVPQGILTYVTARKTSALQQLESYTPSEFDVQWVAQRIDTNAVDLSARVDGTVESLQANYSWDGSSFMTGSMNDDDSDGIFNYAGPLFNTNYNKLYYRVIANGATSFPCTPDFHWMTNSTIGVRINEACANNDALIADNAGEYNDWVELYNTTNQPLELTECYLTDNYSNWNRWRLPDTTMQAHGFMLLWLDDDMEQGRNHANFKLGPNEELIMYRVEEGKPRMVDRASGFSPIPDQTWALTEDGGTVSYITGTQQTPGYSNNPAGIDTPSLHTYSLYPNPAKNSIRVQGITHGRICDALGHVVMCCISDGQYDVSNLKAGIFTLMDGAKTIRFCVIEN